MAVTAAFGVFLSSWSWRWRAHGTGDQLCEMENREPRMVDLKQMGLPTSFTRAAAAAYLNVLAGKATAYERRI